ncbi:MAG: Crp/Fnr family transcriptional regulator [Betaproteobacteria bacterium]|nr:MAG: Crp/Fnr family transcriptional regulator [Betaproteobacteria bacterium]
MDRAAFANKIRFMEQYPFFCDASADLQAEILQVSNEAKIPEGTILFDRGGGSNYVALVGSGAIRVYIANENTGREITLYHVGPGETCPINLLSSLLDMPVPATAVVDSDLHAVTLPVRDFKKWMSMDDGVRDFMIHGLAGRYVEVFQQIHEISFGKLDQRLAGYLIDKFAQSAEKSPVVVATHEQIAADLSTAREVVSRLLREFERMGAVDLGRGRVTLLDRKALESLRG